MSERVYKTTFHRPEPDYRARYYAMRGFGVVNLIAALILAISGFYMKREADRGREIMARIDALYAHAKTSLTNLPPCR